MTSLLLFQGFAPAAGPLDIQCWIADLPKYMSEGTRFFWACAKPTFSGMGCRCVSCHDFGALGSGWEKFKRVQKLEEELRRVRRQLSGGRKEPRSQEEAKRSPRRRVLEPRGRQDQSQGETHENIRKTRVPERPREFGNMVRLRLKNCFLGP